MRGLLKFLCQPGRGQPFIASPQDHPSWPGGPHWSPRTTPLSSIRKLRLPVLPKPTGRAEMIDVRSFPTHLPARACRSLDSRTPHTRGCYPASRRSQNRSSAPRGPWWRKPLRRRPQGRQVRAEPTVIRLLVGSLRLSQLINFTLVRDSFELDPISGMPLPLPSAFGHEIPVPTSSIFLLTSNPGSRYSRRRIDTAAGTGKPYHPWVVPERSVRMESHRRCSESFAPSGRVLATSSRGQCKASATG